MRGVSSSSRRRRSTCAPRRAMRHTAAGFLEDLKKHKNPGPLHLDDAAAAGAPTTKTVSCRIQGKLTYPMTTRRKTNAGRLCGRADGLRHHDLGQGVSGPALCRRNQDRGSGKPAQGKPGAELLRTGLFRRSASDWLEKARPATTDSRRRKRRGFCWRTCTNSLLDLGVKIERTTPNDATGAPHYRAATVEHVHARESSRHSGSWLAGLQSPETFSDHQEPRDRPRYEV